MSGTPLTELPFKGLMPYEEADALFFFGREEDCGVITSNLMASRLTVLYGPSGGGKSSVLHAGVAHQVRQLAQQNLKEIGKPEFAAVVHRSWRDDPVPGLLARVQESVEQTIGRIFEPAPAGTTLADALAIWAERLNGTLLIILDQFEEYFLYHPREEGPRSFSAEFPVAVNRPDLHVNFLLSLREDSLAKLDRFEGKIRGLFENYLRLAPLDQEEGRKAIRGPVEEFNKHHQKGGQVAIEPELVEQVLAQVKSGAVELVAAGRGVVAGSGDSAEIDETAIETSYLQLVMTRLWEEEQRLGSRTLRLETFTQKLGGARAIVRSHFDDVMERLSPIEREVAADVLPYLVTPSGAKIAQEPPFIAARTERPIALVDSVLARLAAQEGRILRRVSSPDRAESYEIFHDVLARVILDYVTVQDAERVRERARRQYWIIAGLAAGLVFALFLSVFAWRESTIANAALAEANAQAKIARDNADKAREQKGIAEDRRKEAEANLHKAKRQQDRADKGERTARRNLYVAHMNLAQNAWKQGYTHRAIGLLDDQTSEPDQDDLRGFEWYYLWQLCNGSAQTVRGHNDIVRSVAFSPDGRILATGSNDNSVKVWDMSRPGIRLFDEQRAAFPFPEQVNFLAFAPDGKTLATGHDHGIVRLLDPTTGRVRATLGGKSSGDHCQIMSVAFSPDGKVLASGSMDDTVKLWDAASGQETRILDLSRGIIGMKPKQEAGHLVVESLVPDGAAARDGRLKPGDWIVRVSGPDGSLVKTEGMTVSDAIKLITGIPGTQVRLEVVSADAPKLKVIELNRKKAAIGDYGVKSVAFSPDGKTLAVGNCNHTVTLWDVATGRRQAPLSGADHSNYVNAVAFSPDGKTLASGSGDMTIKLWDLSTRQERAILPGHTSAVENLAFSADGKTLASGSDDSTVRFWDVATARERSTPLGHTHKVYSVAFSPDGSKLVAGCHDGTVRLWDLSAKPERATTTDRHTERINAITFSPDGTTMATVSHDKTAKLWDVTTGRVRATFLGHMGGVLAVKFTPGGKTLLTGSSDMSVKGWDSSVDSNRPGLAGLPLGLQLVAAGYQGGFQYKEKSTVALEGKGHTATIKALAFSPDGTMLASASDDKTVTLWDVATGKLRATLPGDLQSGKGHTSTILSIAFAPDGKTLASGSWDNTARLWDTATLRSGAIFGHENPVFAVAFSPVGTKLATGTYGGDVKLWDPSTQKKLADLIGHQSHISFITFSPDGQRLASGDQAGTVKIWDVPSRQELLTLRTEGVSLSAMAFAPDGKTLVTGGDDGSVRWWRGASDMDVDRDYFERLKLNRRAVVYSRVIEHNPDNAEVWYWLGCVSAEQGEWAKAAKDFDTALKKGKEDKDIRYRHALLCVEIGDTRGYRDTCAALLGRFGLDADTGTANSVAWSCALGPDAVHDLSQPVRLAEKAVAESPGTYLYLNTLGAVLYRAGAYDDTIRRLDQAMKAHGQGGNAWDWLFLAMAHQRAGRPEEARRWYDKAASWIEQAEQGKVQDPYLNLAFWWNKLELRVLRREAEALLRSSGR